MSKQTISPEANVLECVSYIKRKTDLRAALNSEERSDRFIDLEIVK